MAGGTKLMKEINEQFLVCKICFEPYKNPKTLTCLHTFCSNCLQKHTDAERERSPRFSLYSRYLYCPICRKKTEIPSGGIRKLPDNFLVSNLTNVVNRLKTSKVPPCEICHTVRSRSNDACSKCLECGKLLCKSCVELHLKTKVTQNHSLFDLEGEKDVECKIHPEEIVRFYCEPCDACICVVCTFQEHRDHEICSFSEGFAKYRTSLDSLLNQCKERSLHVLTRLRIIGKCEAALKETRERIRDLAISYISQVRATEKQLLQKVDATFDGDILSFLQNREWLQENFDNLQSTCSLAEIVMKDKGIELLLLKRELQGKLGALLEPSLPVVPTNVSKQVKFVPGSVKLGHLSVTNEEAQGDLEEEKDDYKSVHVQTDDIIQSESSTTMNSNMNQRLCPAASQTVPAETVSRQSNTDPRQVRDRGTYAYLFDPRTRGTMTEVTTCKNTRTQTQSVSVYDQEVQVNMMSGYAAKKTFPSAAGCQGRKKPTPFVTVTCETGTETDITVPPGEWLEPQREKVLLLAAAREGLRYEGRRVPRYSIRSTKTQTTQEPVSRTRRPTPSVVAGVERAATGDPQPAGTWLPRKSPESCSVTADATVGSRFSGSRCSAFPRGGRTETGPNAKCGSRIPTSEMGARWRLTAELSPSKTVDACAQTMGTGRVSCWEAGTDRGGTLAIGPTSGDDIAADGNKTDQATSVCLDVTDRAASPETSVPGHQSVSRRQVVCGTQRTETNGPMVTGETDRTLAERVDAGTETVSVALQDAETFTAAINTTEQWTLTVSAEFINTGTSPITAPTREVGICTYNPVIVNQGMVTNKVELVDSETETQLALTDNETLTDRTVRADAQTSAIITNQDSQTWTDFSDTGPTHDEGQVQRLKQNEMNHSNSEGQAGAFSERCSGDQARKSATLPGASDQQNISRCSNCSKHLAVEVVSRATMSSPTPKHDQSTMILSFSPANVDIVDKETQTGFSFLVDKSADVEMPDADVARGCCDMGTSTESLPYMGLLSEVDVDELYLVPETGFELVSSESSDLDNASDDVEMVDGETCTEARQCVELGTQTATPVALRRASARVTDSADVTKEGIQSETKNLVSIGINTVRRPTFEKETNTPPHHFFSKGKTTFYISKTDPMTSLFEPKAAGQRSEKASCSDKVTMTVESSMADKAIGTDATSVERKMVVCINKLRSVTEKLQSPTSKVAPEILIPGRQFALPCKSGSEQSTLGTPKQDKQGYPGEEGVQPQGEDSAPGLVGKPTARGFRSDCGGTIRKAQPITTLKGRYRENPGEGGQQKSQSLPRQFLSEQSGSVRLGSQVAPPSRLPLLRYNSAPGRIVTLPKQAPKPLAKELSLQATLKQNPLSKNVSGRVSKQQIPSLPAITETRTPSSCSDSSAASLKSSASGNSTPLSSSVISSDCTSGTASSAVSSTSTSPTEDASSSTRRNFVRRFLTRRKKESDSKERPSPSPQEKFGPRAASDPAKDKSSRKHPFVYMRQRIFSIQHEASSPPEKQSPGKPKEGGRKQEKKAAGNSPKDSKGPSKEKSNPEGPLTADGQSFAYVNLC